jgi:hypothetical protein
MDREVKECMRLAEAAIDHLRGQKGHSRYAIGLLNKVKKELLKLEEALLQEDR